ncbi:MAG: amino acid--tRNA ligase-related protein, partial [Acidimicrobiales bacterium]
MTPIEAADKGDGAASPAGGRLARTPVADLAGAGGPVVRVCGWAVAAGPGAWAIRDPTGTGPVTGEAPAPGSAVEVLGEAATDPASGVTVLVAREVRVLGPSEPSPPLGEGAGLEERLDWRYLDLRRPEARLAMEVQTTMERAMRLVWEEQGFVELHTPRLMSTCPRPDELFSLDYFGRPAWL